MIIGQILLYETPNKKNKGGWLCEMRGIQKNGSNDLENWRKKVETAENTQYLI